MSNITNDKVEAYINHKTYASSEIQIDMELYAKDNVVPIVTRDTLALIKGLRLKSHIEFSNSVQP